MLRRRRVVDSHGLQNWIRPRHPDLVSPSAQADMHRTAPGGRSLRFEADTLQDGTVLFRLGPQQVGKLL